MRYFFAILGLAAVIPSFPAAAGPAGSGLALTEELARAPRLNFESSDGQSQCLRDVARQLRARRDVGTADVRGSKLHVVLAGRSAAPDEVRAIVGDACGDTVAAPAANSAH